MQIEDDLSLILDNKKQCCLSITELLFDKDSEYAASSYTIYAEAASGSTGVMLNTLWNQSGVIKLGNNTTITYNEYCPLDGTTHSVTGCTNTAAAQIIYYYIKNFNLDLQLTLTSSDEYTKGGITIKANGSTPGTISFAQINAKLSDYDITSADDAAALLYACGVVQQASYGADATSTAWNSSLFFRSGFASCNNLYVGNGSYDYWCGTDEKGNYYISDAGYEVIIENLLAGRVVGTSYPGHALVIDGYDSVNDKFHINYGWGNSSSTTWYSREEMNEIGYHEFVYDLMLEKQEVLTVSDMDVYGTGTAMRAFEMARSITGSNTINFASSLAGKTLKMGYSLDFKDEITVNDFNITLEVAGKSYGFYGYTDVVANFNSFSGDLIVNRDSSAYGFYFYNADSFNFTGNGAIIYAGSYAVKGDYSAGAAVVLNSLQNSQKNSTAVEDFILTSQGISFYCTNYQDNIVLDNNTFVVGSVYLFGGNDTLKVINNSHLYGSISTGAGNDVITVDSTSSITTTTLGSYDTALNFELNSTINSDAMLTITSSLYYYKYWNFSVDISEAAIGVYTLISAADASYESYLERINITITGSGEAAYTLSVTSTPNGKHANLIYEDGLLKLYVKGYDVNDKTPPSVPTGLKATVHGNGAVLDWGDSTDNNRVEQYFYRYGTSSTLSGEGVAVVDSETILSGLSNGTYYFQVRAQDVSGNYSEWSTVKSFVINHVSTPAMLFQSGLLISSGTSLNQKHLGDQTSMFLSSGGTATSTHVLTNGLLGVSSGGVASRTVVSSGGSMQLYYSGNANSVSVKDGGNMFVGRDATASNVIISGGKVTVSNYGTVTKTTVKSGGELQFYSEASASNVTISSGGIFGGFIFQDAITSYSTLNRVANASNVIVASTAYIYSGMTVDNVDVNYGKKLYVSSGGTASVKFNPWSGTITSYAGAVVSIAQRDKSVYFGGRNTGAISSGNNITNLDVFSGLSALVYSGGTINNINMTSGETNLSGGLISKAVASGGSILLSAGSIDSATLCGSGYLSQYGGTINNLAVQGGTAYLSGAVKNADITGGRVSVYGGNAVVSNVEVLGGSICITSGASVGNTVISQGKMYISNGGNAGNIQLMQSGANLYVSSGGSVGSLLVGDHASAYVSNGGKIDNLQLNEFASSYIYGDIGSAFVVSRSYLYLSSGCSLDKITVGSAGRLYLNAGVINSNILMERGSVLICDSDNIAKCNITINGTLRMSILSTGSLDMQNHTLTFNLQERFVSDAYMIDNLSVISNYKLSITVSANQASGTYELARKASDFTGSITVKCGNSSGSLSVNDSLTIGNATYTLTNDSGYLKLDVKNSNATVLPKIQEYVPGTWATDWQQASEYARKTGKLIFACYGDKSRCGFAGYMNDKLFEDPEFQAFAKEHLILLYETVPADQIYAGSPAARLLYADGSTKAYGNKSGFGATDYKEWMNWLKLQTGVMQGVYIVDSGKEGAFIYSGTGNASDLVINNTNSMYVNDAVLTNGTIKTSACVFIQSGGTTINMLNDGCMYIFSGGTANRNTVNSGGDIYISSGGVANSNTVNSGGEIDISSGGVANSNTLNTSGYIFISSGGVANSNTVNSRGYIYISSGGVANNNTVKTGGCIVICSGGVANSNTLNGTIGIYSGGVANSNTVNSGGNIYISSGGVANSNTVNSGGYIYISSGGVANSNTVNSGGRIKIYSSGVATQLVENGGYVEIAEGATVSFVSNIINSLELNTGMTVHFNTIADSTTLNSGGYINIYSGGLANSNTVNSGGRIYISSGGLANSNTVNSGGRIYISSGGLANSNTVNSSGWINIYSGGVANSNTVNSSGWINIYSGGVANSNTVNSGGNIYISSGGVANSNTVNSGGYIYISSGGVANSNTVNSGGRIKIYSSGVATQLVENGGYVEIAEGATVSFVSNIISSLELNTGMTVHFNTIADSTTLNSGGYINIYSGGLANSNTVNSGGRIYISSGGLANSNTVNSGGRIYIYSGGIHRGNLNINKGATVFAYQGSQIDFTLSDRTPTSDYLINNLSLISGTPTYTITVSNNQASGTYKLAQGASSFKGTISIGDGSTVYGEVSVNTSALNYNNTTYLLEQKNGNLTLNINGTSCPVNKKTPDSNLLENGVSQIVAWDKEKGAVGFVATDGTPGNKWRGVWDWDGKDAELWRVVGVGHFKGSTVDHDGILLYNGIGTTFAAWTNLNDPSYGYVNLCHVEGNFNTKTLSNLDNNQYDDVLIYDEKGSFGVVLDGATYKDIWHVDDAKTNPWTLRGAGNFGGKEEQLVVENKSGHLYLWQNNDTTFKTWNWSQTAIGYLGNDFEFVATGDFMGDGIDDILVRNTNDGGIWMWDNGDSTQAHWEVTPGKGFKAEAVGDYNGDGKDDLLVREYNTGWGGLGYYAFGGDQLWNDLNARIETDLESKFAVIA